MLLKFKLVKRKVIKEWSARRLRAGAFDENEYTLAVRGIQNFCTLRVANVIKYAQPAYHHGFKTSY